MLSICIPVYNYDIVPLINELHIQATSLNIEFEIIVIDDYSNSFFKNMNSIIKDFPNVRYIELEENIGRSKIRNRLAKLAKYDYLIFMDCDSKIYLKNYIKNYTKECNGEIVVCGGTAYEDVCFDQNHFLRWLYGMNRESISAEIRNLTPNKSFATHNFLISKSIFKKVRFNESIVSYGHEDTLFGFDLRKNNYQIKHINNQLYHIGLEASSDFIKKTEQGIINLKFLKNNLKSQDEFFNEIKLMKFYNSIKKIGLHWIFALIFKIFRKSLFNNLTGNKPSLKLFDFYKLGFLSSINTFNK
jgi:GT2 family glycosyltransferase